MVGDQDTMNFSDQPQKMKKAIPRDKSEQEKCSDLKYSLIMLTIAKDRSSAF